jgi:mRNA-degrading endonuclease toxin of MazEF toxin-antitoxin module
VLDQIRCIDKIRLLGKAGVLSAEEMFKVKTVIKEMLVD